MTSENKQWLDLKENYLKQIKETLCAAKQADGGEIIDNVSSHLDRRFAELKEEERTWENFQKIITEMGPPSDYAELLISDACAAKKGSGKYFMRGVLALIGIGIVIGGLWCLLSYRNKPVTPERFRENFTRNIAGFNIDTATLKDVIKSFGEPVEYIWGEQTFSKNNLPNRYVAIYPCGFRVFIMDNQIVELRHESPGDGYVWKGKLKVGSSLDEVIKVLGEPEQTVTGQKNWFTDDILYKDIEGRPGYCYYARKDQNIRLFFMDYKVCALYITRSDYNDH